MINRILRITPLIGSLLIFCGVLKLIFYYSYFDIKITNYLEFQEILTSFFEDLNIILVFLGMMTFFSFASHDLLAKKYNVKANDFIKWLENYIYPRRFRYFLSFSVLAIVLSGLVVFHYLPLNYVIIYILTFSIIQALSYLVLSENDGDIYVPEYYNFVIVALGLVLSIYLFARKDIQDLNRPNSLVKIIIGERVIKCGYDSDHTYIGKTKGYIFVERKEDSLVQIFPIEKIDQFSFKKSK